MALTRKDVEDCLHYMEQHGLIRLNKITGNWYTLHCPFHNNGQERRPSCGCSLEEEVKGKEIHHAGQWHCFACGASYSFGKGIKEILNLKGVSLADHSYLQPFVDQSGGNYQTDSLVPGDMMSSILASYAVDSLKARVAAKPRYVPESELATYRYTVPYMYQRKLTDAIIEKYDVGYDAHHVPPGRSKELPCVTFPVRDIKGNTLFICRRSIEGKYFNYPEGVEKPVYGMYELPPNCKEAIICESIFNALTCVAYGYSAVALLGTGTPYQMNQLRRLGVQSYVICLDNDAAGRRGAAKVKKALTNNSIVWTMQVPEGKDVNDCTYEEFIQAYQSRE